MTIEQYVTYWLDLRKADLAANTHARYRTMARNQVLPYIGTLPLAKVTPPLFEQLYAKLQKSGGARGDPLSTATVGQVHRFLHVCFERAANEGILEHNPLDRVKSPQIESPTDAGGKSAADVS